MHETTIRVVLAEDHALLRDGISRLLDGIAGIELCSTCGDLPGLLTRIETDAPDVVVTDIRMPPTHTDEGLQAARYCRAERPDTGVVVISQYVEGAYAIELLADGTGGRAYLLKERVAAVDELADAIRRVAAGGSVVDPAVVDALVATRAQRRDAAVDRLTPRERDVLAEMATGRSNAAIAAALFLSERAVEKHSTNIFAKLGLSEEPDVNRRVMAVLAWLDADPATA